MRLHCDSLVYLIKNFSGMSVNSVLYVMKSSVGWFEGPEMISTIPNAGINR